MAETFDPDAFVARFAERATAVKKRNLPPVAGDERTRFIEQAKQDYMDYAMVADASVDLTDGILTLTIDLRPET